MIQTSKGWIPFLFDAGKTYILIMTIDYFMESITISWQGVFSICYHKGIYWIKNKEG
ncbi:hypothetical protein ACUC2M_14715 [Bacillus cytotoxicus]